MVLLFPVYIVCLEKDKWLEEFKNTSVFVKKVCLASIEIQISVQRLWFLG